MMTLSGYLERRGKKAKALTRIEAETFGIPYPLQSGWPKRHGGMKITQEMIERIETQAAADVQSDDRWIRRSAKRAAAAVANPAPAIPRVQSPPAAVELASTTGASPVPGFVLRRPKRYRVRKLAPWV